jgi:sugar/nucleoside kinase (ribokinase family)
MPSVWGLTAEQLRALLQLLDMANAMRPEMERALAAKIEPAAKAVATKRGKEGRGDD